MTLNWAKIDKSIYLDITKYKKYLNTNDVD